MSNYTLGFFANMYPEFEGDYRGIFIHQMVRDLESRNITVKKAVKTQVSSLGYFSFYTESLCLSRNRDLDLMQAEYIPHSSVIPAVFGRRDVPLILKFHGDDARIFPFKNPLFRQITRSMLRRAAYVITASEEMQKPLLGLGLDPERCAAIHTGVDTVFFTPSSKENARHILGLSTDTTIFLFVGRLHVWKGIFEIIEVARRCSQFLFVFIGPGTVPDHPSNCMFLGQKNSTEIRMWLNSADCLLLPTHTEAIPTVVMEAFACGTPAITTNIGGCPEIVEDGRNGLLVPLNDVNMLQDAVIWMHDNPESRRRMGDMARTDVLKNFDHDSLIEKLIRIHQSLME
jgi:teichuronic acid biosynthesis glycosyltransferase TuaC